MMLTSPSTELMKLFSCEPGNRRELLSQVMFGKSFDEAFPDIIIDFCNMLHSAGFYMRCFINHAMSGYDFHDSLEFKLVNSQPITDIEIEALERWERLICEKMTCYGLAISIDYTSASDGTIMEVMTLQIPGAFKDKLFGQIPFFKCK